MARRTRGRWAYDTDLTDSQRALIREAEPGGRPRKAPPRKLVDAIPYFLRRSQRGDYCRIVAGGLLPVGVWVGRWFADLINSLIAT